MNYDEAIKAEVTAREAETEVTRHHADFEEFQRDHGKHETYSGQVILDWLGY